MKAHLTKVNEEEVLLKKEYDLQLPNNYVEIEREEMKYVDGGMDRADGSNDDYVFV